MRPAHDVGAPVARKRRVVVERAVREPEGERVPGLERLDPRQLESAEQLVHGAALVEEALALSHGELVERRSHPAVVPVEARPALLDRPVVDRRASAARVVAVLAVDRLRVCVKGREGQAA